MYVLKIRLGKCSAWYHPGSRLENDLVACRISLDAQIMGPQIFSRERWIHCLKVWR